MPQAIGLVEAGLDLLLHSQRELERHRRHGLDQQLADRGIDLGAEDTLAQGLRVAPPTARAHVVRHELPATPGAVADLHAAATQPADDAALQQGGPFAGRALPALPAQGLHAGVQLVLDALVLRPRDVPGVGVPEQHVPLLARHAFPSRAAVGLLPPAVSAIRVGAGVPGVMQEMDGPAQAERRPCQFALARPRRQADGEEQPLFTEVLDGGVRGARAEEGLEEQPHALLDLRVGVEGHAAVRGVDEADGQMAAQLAAARLIQDAAAQAGPQHVQLGFAHGPLETQQQAVVEVRGIVDAILVEDEGVSECADLQQPVPVGRVAGQARHLQPEDDARAAQPDIGDEVLEAGAIDGGSPRLAEVGVDDDHAFRGPAQRDGPLPEAVLALRALGVLEDLSHRRLTDVQVRVPLEVTGRDFLGGGGTHALFSLRPLRAMLASTSTTAAWIASDTRDAAAHRSGCPGGSAEAAPSATWAIQPVSPSRSSRTRPTGPLKGAAPSTRRRSAS